MCFRGMPIGLASGREIGASISVLDYGVMAGFLAKTECITVAVITNSSLQCPRAEQKNGLLQQGTTLTEADLNAGWLIRFQLAATGPSAGRTGRASTQLLANC